MASYMGDSGMRCLTFSEQLLFNGFAQITSRASLLYIEVTFGAKA
jgi:hypothetical protein